MRAGRGRRLPTAAGGPWLERTDRPDEFVRRPNPRYPPRRKAECRVPARLSGLAAGSVGRLKAPSRSRRAISVLRTLIKEWDSNPRQDDYRSSALPLSFPRWRHRSDSNRHPPDPGSGALPLSFGGIPFRSGTRRTQSAPRQPGFKNPDPRRRKGSLNWLMNFPRRRSR